MGLKCLNHHVVFIVVIVGAGILLVGCKQPQIISPMNSLFAPNEYLVIETKTSSRIGQLYEATPASDDEKSPPLRWQAVPILIFPQGENFNEIETQDLEQTRNVVQEAGASTNLTAAAFGAVEGEEKSAFKYQSKSSRFHQLKMPLIHNPKAKEYMTKRLKAVPAIRFAYMSGLYEGTAFIEVLNDASTTGSGNYAAFQMNGNYYTASMSGVINSGPIIYQIEAITIDQLLDRDDRGVRRGYAPMTDQQLRNALQKADDEVRSMILMQ